MGSFKIGIPTTAPPPKMSVRVCFDMQKMCKRAHFNFYRSLSMFAFGLWTDRFFCSLTRLFVQSYIRWASHDLHDIIV